MPLPNPACYVPIAIPLFFDPADAAPAAALRVPTKLKAVYDCMTTRFAGYGSAVERDITYEAFWTDQSGDHILYGAFIKERLTSVTGPKPSELGGGTTAFLDTIGVGKDGPFEVKQTFTVTYNGQTYSNLPLFDAFGHAVSGNTNDISVTATSVSVNNNTKAKNGNCQ